MNKYIQICNGVEFHYYKEIIQAHKGPHSFCELNELHEVIVVEGSKGKSLEEIFQYIGEKYEFEVTNPEARQLFENVIFDLCEKRVIELINVAKETDILISGEKGKTYPFWISFEITSKCCFACPHCYKNANHAGSEITIDRFKEIISYFMGKTPHLIITGGEALTHKNINEILEEALKYFKVHLLTNGYFLQKVKKENLEKLEAVQISLYGYDDESYENFTGVKEGASTIQKVYNYLYNLNIQKINTTLTVMPQNILFLNKYLEFAINLGVSFIFLGVSIPAGRALNNKNTMFKTEKEKIYNILETSIKEYQDRLEFNDVLKNVKTKPYKDYKFHCQAGKTNIVISESGKVRPCLLLDSAQGAFLTVEEYVEKYVKNGFEAEYEREIKKLSEELKDEGGKLSDFECAGFCEF